jgi:hypothetical protein
MEVQMLMLRVLLQPSWGLQHVAQKAGQRVETGEGHEAVGSIDVQEVEGEFDRGEGHFGWGHCKAGATAPAGGLVVAAVVQVLRGMAHHPELHTGWVAEEAG